MTNQTQPSATHSSATPTLKVEGLETTFFLKSGPFRAVRGLNYSIYPGETLGIVGESGCGKSVTSLAVMRLIENPGKITAGQVMFEGVNLTQISESKMEDLRGSKIAMIFQEPMTALNPVLTIGQQIDEQILCHEKISHAEARERSIEMLRLVGIPSPEERYTNYPHQLSGGMRQRAMIAMALSCRPKLLIADEPTTALDVTIQAQILELIQSLQKKFNMAVQFITHDLGVISEISDRVLVMYGGQVCESAPTQELFKNPQHPYTAALMNSKPTLGNRARRLQTIEGTVPAPHEFPKGCPFANRCPRATAECWDQTPPVYNAGPDHIVACFHPLNLKGGNA